MDLPTPDFSEDLFYYITKPRRKIWIHPNASGPVECWFDNNSVKCQRRFSIICSFNLSLINSLICPLTMADTDWSQSWQIVFISHTEAVESIISILSISLQLEYDFAGLMTTLNSVFSRWLTLIPLCVKPFRISEQGNNAMVKMMRCYRCNSIQCLNCCSYQCWF